MCRHHRLLGVFAVLLILAACAPLAVTPTPQTEPDAAAPITPLVNPASATPIRILFIGNSNTFINQGLDVHLKAMAAAAVPPITVDASSVTIPGATLAELWEGSDAVDVIRTGDWDVVVLQNCGTHWPDEYEAAVTKFFGVIAESGTTPLIFAQWDDINDPGSEVSQQVSARSGIPVAPTSTAWDEAMFARPDLSLQDDEIEWHANVPGTYLNTAVLYATIFGLNPQENPYRPVQLLPDLDTVAPSFKRDMERIHEQWTISDEDAAFLQQIAWEAVTHD